MLIQRFVSSTYGKGIIAIREDEIAAEIMSVNTRRAKMVAFMLSSGLAGVAGGLFAHILGYINPGSFTIMKSTEALVMVYLGGMGSLSGSVLSAVLFTLLLEVLRPLQVIKWVVVPADPFPPDALPNRGVAGPPGADGRLSAPEAHFRVQGGGSCRSLRYAG